MLIDLPTIRFTTSVLEEVEDNVEDGTAEGAEDKIAGGTVNV